MYIDSGIVMRAEAATEVEALRKALGEAEGQAVQQQAARKKLEARVKEVQQDLRDAVNKCETLESDASAQGAELTKARQSTDTARNEAQAALQRIQEARKITAGKAFKMQSKYAEKQYLLLTRVRSSPGAFADLPCSVSDAVEFYRAEGGGSTEKLFRSQYAVSEPPVSFTDQLKQLVELHKVAELAMKDLTIRLWPAEAMPGSYFGLVRRMVNAYPRLDVIKRSACIEGACMAFARFKMWWAKMNVVEVASGPPEGKEHRTPERYFADVVEGPQLVAAQCSQDIVFE